MKPFGTLGGRGIDESESAEPACETREVQEALRSPVGVEADDEHGVVVAGSEERVERHDEAAFGRGCRANPRDLLELAREASSSMSPDAAHARAYPARCETMHRLADLADRAALERERGAVDTASSPW